jgi:hypothetical protein
VLRRRPFLYESPRTDHLQRLSFFTDTLGQSSTGSPLAIACSGGVYRLPQTCHQLLKKLLLHGFLFGAQHLARLKKFSG